MEFVDFRDDFESNVTACLGCECVITMADLWDGEYCCKGCKKNNG